MGQVEKASGTALLGGVAVLALALASRAGTGLRPARSRRVASLSDRNRRAARRLDHGAMTLAASVLVDSGMEHYRGSFQNRTMYVPLAVAASTLTAAALGGRGVGSVRNATFGLAVLTGVAGLGFHAYNILKRPGALSWHNLFYAAPAGAPAALSLAGLIGWCAECVRQARPGREPSIAGFPAGNVVAGIASAGIAGTVAETGLLHFRGAFQNPAMLLPVTLPPLASLLLAGTAANRPPASRRLTRGWLRVTALLGIAGVGFHAYGVQRMMGGWRNWSQNVLDGPPLPAPPSYTGLAIAGLAALQLLDDPADDRP